MRSETFEEATAAMRNAAVQDWKAARLVVLKAIDEATTPRATFSKRAALGALEELISDLEGRREALLQEMAEEADDAPPAPRGHTPGRGVR